MIVLHTAPTPNGQKASIALEELGLEYEARYVVEIFGREMDRLMGVTERILSDGRDFLVGPYSIADIMHYPWILIARNAGLPCLNERPLIASWLDRVGKRPAVQEGMKVPRRKAT